MSRKYDRARKVNEEVRRILEDTYTMHYLAGRIIRRKPKLMPRFVWKLCLLIVLAPSAKEKQPVNA